MFEKMCWMDVEQYLKKDDRIVVVVGSCEQHGYLSLATDTLEPLEIAKAACKAENIPIAPPINYGLNPFFNAYPGNVSLSVVTFSKLVKEILQSLINHGFRRILVSNGHGGNSGVLTLVIDEILNGNPGVKMSFFQWWLHQDVDRVAIESGLKQAHANWSENHAFTKVREVPNEPKPFVTLPKVANAAEIRQILGDGSTGGCYEAPSEVMKKFFETAVSTMSQEIAKL